MCQTKNSIDRWPQGQPTRRISSLSRAPKPPGVISRSKVGMDAFTNGRLTRCFVWFNLEGLHNRSSPMVQSYDHQLSQHLAGVGRRALRDSACSRVVLRGGPNDCPIAIACHVLERWHPGHPVASRTVGARRLIFDENPVLNAHTDDLERGGHHDVPGFTAFAQCKMAMARKAERCPLARPSCPAGGFVADTSTRNRFGICVQG